MTKQEEKLSILVRDFRKLDEIRKDYIGELTRILADIHNGKFSIGGTELGDIVFRKREQRWTGI
jgi:hypothetical protein